MSVWQIGGMYGSESGVTRSCRRAHYAKAGDLEAAIDRVGRDRVFAKAKAIGWKRLPQVPVFVWWGIISELEQAQK